ILTRQHPRRRSRPLQVLRLRAYRRAVHARRAGRGGAPRALDAPPLSRHSPWMATTPRMLACSALVPHRQAILLIACSLMILWIRSNKFYARTGLPVLVLFLAVGAARIMGYPDLMATLNHIAAIDPNEAVRRHAAEV